MKIKSEKHKFKIISNVQVILSENDSCKYIIGNTSKYYYIKDDCKGKVTSYPMSEVKEMSFNLKE